MNSWILEQLLTNWYLSDMHMDEPFSKHPQEKYTSVGKKRCFHHHCKLASLNHVSCLLSLSTSVLGSSTDGFKYRKVQGLWVFFFLVFSLVDVHIFLPLTQSCTLAPFSILLSPHSLSWLCIVSLDSAMPAPCHVLQPSCTLVDMECCCCCLVSYQWKE